ncbi:Gmad2 immunoglobulin-like domain-containing protein [Pseudonocardia nigra]|uniref:Gmad2 immunoglobulin-like domain-containing protein n=1 Tax=Pseudonocardia nigra TaxID=1921578 RepID=UPI001C5F159A|nr:Gmad2 immunoglobulin-like domain-containing protein [Pseudonocardia nigra]
MGLRRIGPVVLLVVVLAGCGGSGPTDAPPVDVPSAPSSSTPPDPSSPSSPSSPPATSPTSPPPTTAVGEATAVAVYYVADTAAGYRLQREFHRVVTADPASDAVREMLAEPTGIDPDYLNHWPPTTTLRSPVRTDDGAIVVDLSGVAGANVGTELAHLTVQQLVFTVQGALQSTDPVRVLVDGEPVEELWGAVATAEAVGRGDTYALRSLVQIDSPAHGATVGREVEVTGEAAVFEATVLWEVLQDGQLVRSGSTSTTEGQRFAPFTFTVGLEPGEYTVRVLEADPSGGEGRPVLTDDKAITVTG